ncbi:hypothetical protein PsorP6_009491 [Peronosclerospora sorghi]|uniref:Uncharacterized protein n=1 Tax=Peronosclerospora sorghi TaxID=230839 RepID=A0ACC0W113_9STRA|nr:hypothetical protein PsorP6_009491 [Peronosclerospora sorghi]
MSTLDSCNSCGTEPGQLPWSVLEHEASMEFWIRSGAGLLGAYAAKAVAETSEGGESAILVLEHRLGPTSSPTQMACVGARRGWLASVSMAGGDCIARKAAEKKKSSLVMSSLLASLNLSKYAALFEAEEIDIESLCLMNAGHLRDLGIPFMPAHEATKWFSVTRRL